MWGHPTPQIACQGLTARCAGANFCCLASLVFKYLPRFPYDCALAAPRNSVVSPLGGFSWFVLLSLFVLVFLFLACLFRSVAWLVWRCLVVAVLGCCVLLCVLFLALLSGVVLLLVLVLLPLLSLSRVWLVVWFGFVLAGVLSAVLFGSSPCPLCAELSSLGACPQSLGVCPPFFLLIGVRYNLITSENGIICSVNKGI